MDEKYFVNTLLERVDQGKMSRRSFIHSAGGILGTSSTSTSAVVNPPTVTTSLLPLQNVSVSFVASYSRS